MPSSPTSKKPAPTRDPTPAPSAWKRGSASSSASTAPSTPPSPSTIKSSATPRRCWDDGGPSRPASPVIDPSRPRSPSRRRKTRRRRPTPTSPASSRRRGPPVPRPASALAGKNPAKRTDPRASSSSTTRATHILRTMLPPTQPFGEDHVFGSNNADDDEGPEQPKKKRPATSSGVRDVVGATSLLEKETALLDALDKRDLQKVEAALREGTRDLVKVPVPATSSRGFRAAKRLPVSTLQRTGRALP
mmetsp:Transcript_4981/g.16328  ORF Transcript_4981/g.16328 Transcript_4981/m.16328 type:complete len:247 (+) Transcript_4981:391-1131(+)